MGHTPSHIHTHTHAHAHTHACTHTYTHTHMHTYTPHTHTHHTPTHTTTHTHTCPHTHTHTHTHTHSNPQVQQEVLQYGGLSLLCQLISSSEPEMVQRRSLFAVSALLRGNLQDQQVSVAVSCTQDTHHQQLKGFICTE